MALNLKRGLDSLLHDTAAVQQCVLMQIYLGTVVEIQLFVTELDYVFKVSETGKIRWEPSVIRCPL